MWFIAKILISGLMIAFASWLAGRTPILAGFLIALPITSMLSIIFAYLENKDMNKINGFASSILIAVPLSLLFFVPFLLNKWLKLSFALSYGFGILLLIVGYMVHLWIFKAGPLK